VVSFQGSRDPFSRNTNQSAVPSITADGGCRRGEHATQSRLRGRQCGSRRQPKGAGTDKQSTGRTVRGGTASEVGRKRGRASSTMIRLRWDPNLLAMEEPAPNGSPALESSERSTAIEGACLRQPCARPLPSQENADCFHCRVSAQAGRRGSGGHGRVPDAGVRGGVELYRSRCRVGLALHWAAGRPRPARKQCTTAKRKESRELVMVQRPSIVTRRQAAGRELLRPKYASDRS